MANNIAVSITADVADLVTKRAILSAELKAATADLTAFAKTAAATGAAPAGMQKAAVDVAKYRAEIAALDTSMKSLSHGGGGSVFAGLGKGLESIKGGAESITALRASVLGVGEALGAAFAVDGVLEWAKKMGEAGEQTEHTAQILGTSVGAVQQLNAAFALMGVDAQTGLSGVERLDKAFAKAQDGGKAQAAVFRQLGVSTAHLPTQMQMLAEVMNGFAKQADGPKKVAEAMALFGRSGAALIPFLDLGAKGLAQLNEITGEYAVVNDAAAEKAAQLGESFNENKVAMLGVNNVLASEFAPSLNVAVQGMNSLTASWISSYKQGGAVKTVLGDLKVVFNILAEAVGSFGLLVDLAFKGLSGVVKGFGADWNVVKDSVGGSLTQLGDQFVGMGKVIYDSLTQNLMNAASDMRSTENQMAADAAATARKIKADLADAAAAGKPDWTSAVTDSNLFEQWENHQDKGDPKQAVVKPTGEGADDGDASGGGRGKKPKDDTTSQWTQQLEELKAAQANWYADEDQLAADFWAKIVASAQGSAKDQEEAALHLAEAREALDKRSSESAIAAAKKEAEAAGDNVDKVKEIYAALEAKLTASHQLGAANRQKIDEAAAAAVNQATEKAANATREVNAEALAELKSNLDTARSIRENDARAQEALLTKSATGNPIAEITAARQVAAIHAQLLQQQIADDLAEQQLKDKLLQDDINAAKVGSDAYTKAVDAKRLADLEFANQHRLLENQVVTQAATDAQAVAAKWVAALQPIGAAFDQMFQAMFSRQETFGQAMLKLGDQILFKMVNVATESAEKWAASELAKTAVTKAGAAVQVATKTTAAAAGEAASTAANARSVFQDAKVAAAGAYAAVSQIPVVGPLLAPEAAAAAFTGVMAFASFDRGADRLPADMLAMVHAGERIVPAADNAAMISLLRHAAAPMVLRGAIGGSEGASRGGGGAGSPAMTGGAAGGGGAPGGNTTINLHHAPIVHNATMPVDLDDVLETQGHKLAKWLAESHRTGSFRGKFK